MGAERPAPTREQPRSQQLPASSFQLQPQQQQFQPQQEQFQQPQGIPFINPADPTHQDFQFNTNAAQFQPQQPARQPQQTQQQFQPQQRFQPQQQFQQPQQRQPETFNPSEFSSSIPACAGCQDLNTFINPADPSHAALFQQQQSFREAQVLMIVSMHSSTDVCKSLKALL